MNTQTYIIEDIHPRDRFYSEKERFIGKKITNVVFDETEWIPGWKGTSSFTAVDFEYNGRGVWFAVKVSPVTFYITDIHPEDAYYGDKK